MSNNFFNLSKGFNIFNLWFRIIIFCMKLLNIETLDLGYEKIEGIPENYFNPIDENPNL